MLYELYLNKAIVKKKKPTLLSTVFKAPHGPALPMPRPHLLPLPSFPPHQPRCLRQAWLFLLTPCALAKPSGWNTLPPFHPSLRQSFPQGACWIPLEDGSGTASQLTQPPKLPASLPCPLIPALPSLPCPRHFGACLPHLSPDTVPWAFTSELIPLASASSLTTHIALPLFPTFLPRRLWAVTVFAGSISPTGPGSP